MGKKANTRAMPFVTTKVRKRAPGNRNIVDYFLIDPDSEDCPVVYLGSLEVQKTEAD